MQSEDIRFLKYERLALAILRQFLEQVVIIEKNVSVIKVMGYIILKMLQGNQPKTQVEISYAEFESGTNLNREAIHAGLKRAIEAGYIRVAQQGSNRWRKSSYEFTLREEGPSYN